MEFPQKLIVIDKVKKDKDGDNDGTDLEHCFFIWFKDSQTYSFCDKFGNGLKQGLRVGETFTFHFGIDWNLTIDSGSDLIFVTGRWVDPTGEGEGSYQATAGGGAEDEENAVSATV